MILLAVAWASVGALIGFLAGSIAASVILAIAGFIGGLAIHLWAIEWVQDISSGGE